MGLVVIVAPHPNLSLNLFLQSSSIHRSTQYHRTIRMPFLPPFHHSSIITSSHRPLVQLIILCAPPQSPSVNPSPPPKHHSINSLCARLSLPLSRDLQITHEASLRPGVNFDQFRLRLPCPLTVRKSRSSLVNSSRVHPGHMAWDPSSHASLRAWIDLLDTTTEL